MQYVEFSSKDWEEALQEDRRDSCIDMLLFALSAAGIISIIVMMVIWTGGFHERSKKKTGTQGGCRKAEGSPHRTAAFHCNGGLSAPAQRDPALDTHSQSQFERT